MENSAFHDWLEDFKTLHEDWRFADTEALMRNAFEAGKEQSKKHIKDEIQWLKRFKETSEDDNTYDTPKPILNSLAEHGLVRHKGGGYYELTTYGETVIKESE